MTPEAVVSVSSPRGEPDVEWTRLKAEGGGGGCPTEDREPRTENYSQGEH